MVVLKKFIENIENFVQDGKSNSAQEETSSGPQNAYSAGFEQDSGEYFPNCKYGVWQDLNTSDNENNLSVLPVNIRNVDASIKQKTWKK